MVGFIGKQKIISSEAPGAFVSSFEALALSNGTVINAYFPLASGALEFWAFNGSRDEPTKVGNFEPNSFAQIGSSGRMRDPSLFENKDGGFTLIINRPVGNATTDGELVMQKYSASGSAKGGLKTLADGFIDAPKAIALDNGGFFLSYYDRSVEGSFVGEKLGLFYNAKGKEVGRTVFDPGSSFTSTGIPDSVVLKNGNVAVTYGVQAGSLVTQVFRPNGDEASDLIPVPGANRYSFGTVALPNGGYAVAYTDSTSANVLNIQKFKANGTADGRPNQLDLPAASDSRITLGEPELAITKDGMLAISWAGSDLDNSGASSDIYLALMTLGGDLVFGPAVANSPRTDSQSDPQFDTLANGKLFLSFIDYAFKPFGYQDSVQGVYIEPPDAFWTGTNKANTKTGTSGDDVMLGRGGNDKIDGGKGADYIRGGNGNDTLKGGAKSDDLAGEGGNDQLSGGDGNDTLSGGSGDDTLEGDKGSDDIFGGSGKDRLRGNGGNDTLDGGDGADNLGGSAGADSLLGGTGNDTLSGGKGNDTLRAGDGADLLKGEAGNDYMEGDAGRDVLRGGSGNDVLRGGDDADRVYGGSGNDIIYSDAGNDKEYGGAGDDIFYDSDGNDRMWGQAGADTFRFQDTVFGRDTIKDFEFGIDTLDMGNLARSLDLSGGRAIRIVEVSAGVRFVVDSANYVLVEGASLSDFEAGDYIISDPFAM